MVDPQILVVEDERIVATGIRNMLGTLGYRVPAVAASGEEAIKKAAEIQPDLVLMDIVLQGDMDGIQAAEHIRARFNIPVVYLTAYADEATVRRAKMTAPYGYLLKPFNERELHAAIEMALYKHMMEREATPSAENPELEHALRELVKTKGVNAAAVISKDGVMVHFLNTVTPEEISPLSSMAAMMTRMAEKCTRLLKRGEMTEILTKDNRGTVVTEKCGEFILLVAMDESVDMNAIKSQKKRLKEIILGIL
ncbi:MAG: response regulator [Methanophagales archaeon ANME-1-THS]|nr:MAG: response regulator [Methanophagales archaeon ANME-1-THS]